MTASELLLKFQLWVMQDNVSDLKKRYLFFSALALYILEISIVVMIQYLDPASEVRKVPSIYSIVFVSSAGSLILMGFVYICKLVGIRNLYLSMLLLRVLFIFISVLSEDFQWRATSERLFLDWALGFGSAAGIAWLSLHLNRRFPIIT